MTPKEQAEILVDEYYQLLGEYIFNGHFDVAKNCALIAVDEIIDTIETTPGGYFMTIYWQDVKKEIEQL